MDETVTRKLASHVGQPSSRLRIHLLWTRNGLSRYRVNVYDHSNYITGSHFVVMRDEDVSVVRSSGPQSSLVRAG